jgi:hypothetical protein
VAAENQKQRISGQSDNRVDTGFVGKKAAKLAKRAKVHKRRQMEALSKTEGLLKDAENHDTLLCTVLSKGAFEEGAKLLIKEQQIRFYPENPLKIKVVVVNNK